LFSRGSDERMNDRFEASDRGSVIDDDFRKLGAVHRAAGGRARKGLLDQSRRFPLVQRVNDGVGIVNGHAAFGKKLGGSRFSHGEGAGQAEDERPVSTHRARHPKRRRNSRASRSGSPKTMK